MVENHNGEVVDPVIQHPEEENVRPYSDLQKFFAQAAVVFKRCKAILRKYLWLFLLILICGIGSSAYLILNKELTYQASVTFILQEENEPSVATSVMDPLSNYLLTRNTSQTINLDRMKEISFSQKILTNLLFNKCIIRGRDDYLINHMLVIYYGSENSFFRSFRGLNGLNRNQYRVFSNVSSIVRKSINITQTKSGAYVVTIIMKNEELTKVTTELFYQNLSNFYIDKTTEKAQTNYIFLRNRLDSVRNMLYSSEYQVANFEDRARNLLLNTARVPQARQLRNTQFYQTLYLDLIRSFENSKVSLNNITPIFQLLQRPYYPLSVIAKSSLLILIINLLITFAVIFLLLIIFYVKIYLWPDYKYIFTLDKDLTT